MGKNEGDRRSDFGAIVWLATEALVPFVPSIDANSAGKGSFSDQEWVGPDKRIIYTLDTVRTFMLLASLGGIKPELLGGGYVILGLIEMLAIQAFFLKNKD